MQILGKAKRAPDYIEAHLDYAIAAEGNRIVLHPSLPGGDTGTREGQFVKQKVKIVNGWPMVEALSLDAEGFIIVKAKTKVKDFYDEGQLKVQYKIECENIVKTETNCARAVVFDHTLRSDDERQRREKLVREPVQGAHNDYTDVSASQRVRDFMGADAERLLKGRFSIINIWRSIDGPVETMPLAICDARTVNRNDLIVAERRAEDRIGYTLRLAHNKHQKWFYFPHMQYDEAMLIKSYDSQNVGVSRFTPHTAFVDPNTSPKAAPRQSIETRIFAFY